MTRAAGGPPGLGAGLQWAAAVMLAGAVAAMALVAGPGARPGPSTAGAGRPVVCERPGCGRCDILRAERAAGGPEHDFVAYLDELGLIE